LKITLYRLSAENGWESESEGIRFLGIFETIQGECQAKRLTTVPPLQPWRREIRVLLSNLYFCDFLLGCAHVKG
jgi:hypothetical protein